MMTPTRSVTIQWTGVNQLWPVGFCLAQQQIGYPIPHTWTCMKIPSRGILCKCLLATYVIVCGPKWPSEIKHTTFFFSFEQSSHRLILVGHRSFRSGYPWKNGCGIQAKLPLQPLQSLEIRKYFWEWPRSLSVCWLMGHESGSWHQLDGCKLAHLNSCAKE